MTKTVSGQITPDRLSDIEAEVAQLKATLLEARGDLLTLEGALRDLGQSMQLVYEAHRDLVVAHASLSEHVSHGAEYATTPGGIFCPYCVRRAEL